jgi:hypothetical protein
MMRQFRHVVTQMSGGKPAAAASGKAALKSSSTLSMIINTPLRFSPNFLREA